MRPIQLSKRLCCTCLSRGATANFSREQNRTATCRRFISIQQFSRTHSARTFRWREPGRCQAPLKDLPEERVRNVLAAAAQFRLRQKAARIRHKIDSRGRDEVLFQELATALGYKENKLAFTLITQRLPLRSLREATSDIESMLFGIAGFLRTADLDIYKKSTREYVRRLWDGWWPHRDELQRLILPAQIWRLSSTRPLNHPQRRLAALAILARDWPRLQRALGKSSVSAAKHFFQTLDHPFWNFHYTLTSKASPKENGPDRRRTRCRHSGQCVVSILAGTRSRSFGIARRKMCGRNMRSSRRNYRTADSKQGRRVFSETIRAGNNS